MPFIFFFSEVLKLYSWWKTDPVPFVGTSVFFDTVKDGQCSGHYTSSNTPNEEYSFVGRYDTKGLTIGWTVSLENKNSNAHSVFTWSGQFQSKEIGNEWVLLTTWLQTRQTTPGDADWDSTSVGTLTFRPYMPPFEQEAKIP